MSTPIRNRKAKDRKNRQKLRTRLAAEGLSEELIEKAIEWQRHLDLIARHGFEEARAVAYTEAHRQDAYRDDTGFKPATADPLLHGSARASGIAAKVVRRRDTLTRFQYNAKLSEINPDQVGEPG